MDPGPKDDSPVNGEWDPTGNPAPDRGSVRPRIAGPENVGPDSADLAGQADEEARRGLASDRKGEDGHSGGPGAERERGVLPHAEGDVVAERGEPAGDEKALRLSAAPVAAEVESEDPHWVQHNRRMRPAVSVVFMVKDEADRLGPSLASAGWADEVLVVDTGSTDGTQALARAAGARVESIPWEGYVVTRNRALALATHDWVLVLDADERVSPGLAEEVQRAVESSSGAVAFRMPRLSHVGSKPVRHGVWSPDRKLRLGLRSRGLRAAGGRVHERIETDGPVRELSSPILHFPYRDVTDAARKMALYARLSALDRLDRGARGGLLAVFFRPPVEFLKSWLLKRGFLDGRAGVAVALLHAWYYLLRAAFLAEESERERDRRGR